MLADAVCRDPETGATNPTGLDINVVLEACRNLLMIDQSGVCRFSHLSVQEYLETHHYNNGQAHLEVGSVCLKILLNPANWLGIENLPRHLWRLEEEENILRYTVAHWPDHVRLQAEYGIDHSLQSLVKVFLGSPAQASAAYACWSHRFPPYREQRDDLSFVYSLDFPKSSSPAFAVVLLSLNQILDKWWVSNLDVDLHDDSGRSLLFIAVAAGNLTAARELLDLGANPNTQGGYFGNVLHGAAYLGREVIAHLLLDRGADIHAKGGRYSNALHAAAAGRSEVVVRLLLERGADVNAQDDYSGGALQEVATTGSEVIFRLLLDRGADINALGGCYGSVIQAAVVGGSEVIVRLLLDRGADIDAKGGEYGTALQAAISRGSDAIARLLLDRGADINIQGGY